MFKMTEEQFVKEVKARRQAYIQTAVDFMDALERLDFKSAAKYSLSATDVLGMDIMTELTRWYLDAETDEFDEKYRKVDEELTEAVKTDTEKFIDKINEMEIDKLKRRQNSL